MTNLHEFFSLALVLTLIVLTFIYLIGYFVVKLIKFIASSISKYLEKNPTEVITVIELEVPEEEVEIVHKTTSLRKKIHEEIYARLWPQSFPIIPNGFYGDTTLRLPLLPAKRMVIREVDKRNLAPLESLKKEVINVTSIDDCQYDPNYEKALQKHEALLAQSITDIAPDISEQYVDTDVLANDCIINTTVTESKSSKGNDKVDQRPFSEFKEEVAKESHRRWLDIFSTYIGSNEAETWGKKRNTTCPQCGRDSKFYMINSDTGATHCASSSCGTHCHDGFATIALFTNDKYGKVVRKIAEDFGLVNKTGTKLKEKKIFKESPTMRTTMTRGEERYFKMIMSKSKKLTKRSIQFKYLLCRGIPASAINQGINQLFGMDSLAYVDKDGNKGRYPALVTPISKDGELIGYHRIYLTSDGKKLPMDEAKKPTGNYPLAYSGAVIKLGGPVMKDGVYRISEGVETALAVTALTGKPCWPTMTAAGIQTFIVPEDAKKVIIYADLDLSKTGEIVADKLSKRMQKENPDVTVEIKYPSQELWDRKSNPKGIDFLDVFNLTQKNSETV